MKKFLLGVCTAVAFWINDAGAMNVKTEDGRDISVSEFESADSQFVMISRWELGNKYYMGGCRYLYIDYRGTKEKFDREKSKADITREMEDLLYTLPKCIGRSDNLTVLDVHDSVCNEVSSYSRGIHLKSLPDSIGNLKNLRILDLSNNYLTTLPESIGNLKNLEELNLSNNYGFSKLPESIGNLKNLRTLKLKRTNLGSLPESVENLINLEDLSLSQAVEKEGPHTYGVDRSTERVYGEEDYLPNWYLEVIDKSLQRWLCPTLDFSGDEKNTFSLDLSGKNLKQIPFGVYMMGTERVVARSRNDLYNYDVRKRIRTLPALKELDVSNNQITKIPRLLGKLWSLEKLYIHNNPNLNHLPDCLWKMYKLKELKIDGKLIKDLPENAKVSLEDKKLENQDIIDLILAGKNNKKMSDEALDRKTGPYIVRLH